MQTEIREESRTVTVRLQGELDHHTVKDIRERIDEAIFRCKPELVTLDFSGVTFMDSSGVGMILGRAEAIGRFHGRLRLTGASPAVGRVLTLCGLEKIPAITFS